MRKRELTTGRSDEWADGRNQPTKKRHYFYCILVLTCHAALLGWAATRHSPSNGEVPALSAGVRHWQTGRFDLFRVNPPLVRLAAALPVMRMEPGDEWARYPDLIGTRPEFDTGCEFIHFHDERSLDMFIAARWACIPFSLLGGFICFFWARDLYGPAAGCLAVTLWGFSPNILAHSQMITPDAPAASMGAAAAYFFWCWLRHGGWPIAIVAGLTLGLAELTKSTWIILFGLWPLLYLVWLASDWAKHRGKASLRHSVQLASILVLGLVVLNIGYGCEGSFTHLGDFNFCSKTLAGDVERQVRLTEGGNRFRETWLAGFPVPFPEDYVLGIDIQRQDFELKHFAYLRGEWKSGGWWYYYLVAGAFKVPLGTILLGGVAIVSRLFVRYPGRRVRDDVALLLPPLCVIALVSSQTALNQHFRYVIPAFSFLFIWISQVAYKMQQRHLLIKIFVMSAVLWMISVSLRVYPHSLSFFNEFAGGPAHGQECLLGSNLDWGQDITYLKRFTDSKLNPPFIDERSGAPEIRIALSSYYAPEALGVADDLPPPPPVAENAQTHGGPTPGWYALSVNEIHGRDERYHYFLYFEPVDTAGYSIYIYHVTLEDANRVRRELGLPELQEDTGGIRRVMKTVDPGKVHEKGGLQVNAKFRGLCT